MGGVRRRDVASICDEMAHLFHDRAVRYFYFVDQHMLPGAEDEALRFLSTWAEGLRERGVGPVGIGAMFRVDRLTPALVRPLAELGLVRAFVSLEIATAHEGRSVGRLAPRARDLALLGALAEAGVTTVSNLMLVNPYSTPATIAAGIDLLERVPAGVFEATRMMVYHGTRLHQRMAEQGRLIGNPLRYGYTFADPTTERFAEIFSRLRGEAFWNYSVAYRTHDSYLALALARRLHADRVQPQVVGKLDAVRGRVNRLYLDGYRRALALASSGGGFAESGGLVLELRGLLSPSNGSSERVEAQNPRGRPSPRADVRADARCSRERHHVHAGRLHAGVRRPVGPGRHHGPRDVGRRGPRREAGRAPRGRCRLARCRYGRGHVPASRRRDLPGGRCGSCQERGLLQRLGHGRTEPAAHRHVRGSTLSRGT